MNISHLGSEAEVQLAEALVAVSEAVVAAAAEVDDTPPCGGCGRDDTQ